MLCLVNVKDTTRLGFNTTATSPIHAFYNLSILLGRCPWYNGTRGENSTWMCLKAKADGDTAERNGTTLTSKYVSSILWSIGRLNTYEAVVIAADGVGLARRATSCTDDGDGGARNTNKATEVVSGDSEGTEEASNGGAVRL